MNNQSKKSKNYLSTQVKAIIVFMVLIVVFIPLWFLVLKPEKTPTTNPGTKTPSYTLYDHAVYVGTDEPIKDLKDTNIQSMHVTRQGETWGFVYDYTEEQFFLDGYGKKIAYDTYVCDYFKYYTTAVPALKLIAEDVTDFGRYGLADDSENLIKVTIKTHDDKEIELRFGDELVDTTGYYATTAGNDKVYSINSFAYGYFNCNVYDVMNVRITNPFTESQYVPNHFAIYHGSDKFVELEYYDPESAVGMEYIKTTLVVYPTAYIPYGASTHYSDMIYKYLRASINGERVVAAEKENETFTPEYLKETFGIDAADPKCKRLVYNRVFDDVGLIENDVLFSPKDKDGYYYAYNLALGTVVKISENSIPFMDWDAEQYMEPAVYLQSINTIKKLTINSVSMRELYEKNGHKKLNETFISNAPAEVDADKLKVTHDDGSTLKDVYEDGKLERTGLDNYRYLVLALQSVDIHEKMNEADLVDKQIDLSKPDITVTIETRAGAQHVLCFYYYGSSGAYFTYNGQGGYSVPQSALKDLLTACYNVCNGLLVPGVL